MVSSTVPAENIGSHVEEHAPASQQATTAVDKTSPEQAQQQSASTAPAAEKKLPAAPAVNPWKLPRKDAAPAKPVVASNPEAEAEKRVESIIENIKEVTLGKLIMYIFILFLFATRIFDFDPISYGIGCARYADCDSDKRVYV